MRLYFDTEYLKDNYVYFKKENIKEGLSNDIQWVIGFKKYTREWGGLQIADSDTNILKVLAAPFKLIMLTLMTIFLLCYTVLSFPVFVLSSIKITK